MITRKAGLHRFDDGNTARNRRFKTQCDAL